MIPTYPDVSITVKPSFPGFETEFRTQIRKRHRRKWYFQIIVHRAVADDPVQKIQESSRFHRLVYIALVMGKVTPNLLSHDNETLYKIDSDQISEEKRLIKLINDGSV